MRDKHFLFSALDIDAPDPEGPAMKLVRPAKRHLQLRQRLQRVASTCQRIISKTA